jgi:hypothetical protein
VDTVTIQPYRAEVVTLLGSGRDTISLMLDNKHVSGASVSWLSYLASHPKAAHLYARDKRLSALIRAYKMMYEGGV